MESLEERIALSTMTADSTAALIADIEIANKSGGTNTIDLEPKTYGLDKVDNYWYGPNGLPPIASDITIVGNGAKIERTGDQPFRLFYVSNVAYGGMPTGTLTLENLTLKGGIAHGGNSYNGGAGLGAGGAIFNQGNLTLDNVDLRNNIARGGDARYAFHAYLAGAGIGQDGAEFAGGFGGKLTGYTSFDLGGPMSDGQGMGKGHDNLGGGFGGGGDGTLHPLFGAGFGGFGAGGGGGTNGGAGSIFDGGHGASGNRYYFPRGGGGAGMGGAIFNRGGTITIENSTLTDNAALGGDGADSAAGQAPSGAGGGLGGAIFNLNGVVTLKNDKITGNDVRSGNGGFVGSPGANYEYIVDGYQVFNLAMFEYSFGPFTPRTATINLSSDTVITGAPSGKQALVSFAARDGDDAYTVNI